MGCRLINLEFMALRLPFILKVNCIMNGIGVLRDSLEEKITLFFDEEDEELDRNSEGDWADDEAANNELHDPIERKEFWDSQEALLLEIMERCNSMGAKLREEIGRVSNSDGCALCLRRRVVDLLCLRVSLPLRTSKWRHTHKFPEEEANPIPYRARIRTEFEMVKACDEYRRLIAQLPKSYIGKSDYLNAILRVVCDAAKRSMKEQKIHMGPWRKRSFMQMKWSGYNDRKQPSKDQPWNKFSLSGITAAVVVK
ncbi:hypothetical protein AAG906_006579 [Vitis piasezkii]